MAIKVDDVSDVNHSKDTWNIVTKVVRLWVSPSFSGGKLPFSMELVLMDSKVNLSAFLSLKTSGKKSSDGFPDDGVQAVVYDSDAPAVDVPNQDPTGTTADVPIYIQKYAVDQAVVDDSPGFDVPVSQSVVPIAALVKKQVKVVKKTNGKVKCRILTPANYGYAKIGSGWKRLCAVNKFLPFDVLTFRFTNPQDRIVYVSYANQN